MKSIGDGASTRVWLDNWVCVDRPRRPVNKETRINLRLMVADLISPRGSWDVERLNELFPRADVNRIMSFPPNRSMADEWIWAYSKDGKYTVKSGSWLCAQLVCVPKPVSAATQRTNMLKERL
ncbi:hypothetical protein V5N11_026363 [Cardamine amara subsp. amara]|uniref:Uncharacterized protein n=1 Tax=Cardamine amara subsp. amara TaxID=228776 RepID=A0ABD1BBZ6_CARAN